MRVTAHRAVVSRDEPRQSNIQVPSKVDYVLKVLQCYMACPFSWQTVDIVKCVVSGNFVHFLQVAKDKKSGNIIHRTGMKLLLFLTFCVKELVLYCTTLKVWWMVVRNVLVLRRTCNAKRSVNWTQPSVFVFLHGVPGRREVNDQSCTQKKKKLILQCKLFYIIHLFCSLEFRLRKNCLREQLRSWRRAHFTGLCDPISNICRKTLCT